tara:strand:+ start:103076 stop:103522 length:447 start_codon:yes stop_codon:yes gene_type:complete
MTKIKENSVVKVHYTGKLANNEVFDSSKAVEGKPEFEDREPLEVTLGKKQMIPGFEKGLLGMKINEKKTITIPYMEAYGESLKKNFHEVERKLMPTDINEGDIITNNSPKGVITACVAEIKEKIVVLDVNHPLAGKDLIFDLEVVSID